MPGTSIGAILRGERLRQGKDLAAIVEKTKICRPILDALENDRFDCLPGGAYRRSFLLQYARFLDLDEQDLEAAFRSQYEECPVTLPPLRKKRSSPPLPAGAYLLLAAVVILSLYGVVENGLSKHNHTGMVSPPDAQPRPEALASAVSNGPIGKSLRVEFTVTEPVWISVRCDGSVRFVGTMVQPESRAFEASGVVTVLIGNAGGLTISLNGQPLGTAGGHGEVQLVELTAKGARRLPRRPIPLGNGDSAART